MPRCPRRIRTSRGGDRLGRDLLPDLRDDAVDIGRAEGHHATNVLGDERPRTAHLANRSPWRTESMEMMLRSTVGEAGLSCAMTMVTTTMTTAPTP